MSNGTLVLLGDLDPKPLQRIAAEFGWCVQRVNAFEQLDALNGRPKVVAVFFEPYSFDLPWRVALRSVMTAAPATLAIACHRFSDPLDWSDLARAGAFHALSLPFNERELRHSLGFVRMAQLQRAKDTVFQQIRTGLSGNSIPGRNRNARLKAENQIPKVFLEMGYGTQIVGASTQIDRDSQTDTKPAVA